MNLPSRNMKQTAIFKVLSYLTASIFTFTSIAWSAPAISIVEASASTANDRIETQSLIQDIEIPESLGVLKKTPGSSSGALIMIQDAHGSEQAQYRISEILKYLNKYYGTDLIFLEGTFGELDASMLHFFEKDEWNRKLVSLFLKEGITGGASLFLFEDKLSFPDSKTRLFGVEDSDLYRENLRAFQTVMAAKTETGSYLSEVKQTIMTIASRVMNKDLYAFFKQWLFYHDVPNDILRQLDTLKTYARKVMKVDLDDAREQIRRPQLARFFKLKELEGKLDPKKTENDLAGLSALMKKQGISNEQINLVQTLAESRWPQTAGGITYESPRQFVEHLYDMLKPQGFRFKDYPALTRSWTRVILQSEIEASGLFREIRELTMEILKALSKDAQESRMIEIYQDYLLLHKLLNLQLTYEEYAQVKQRAETLKPSKMDLDLLQFQESKNASSEKTDRANSSFEKALSFYEHAGRRDQVIFEKIITRMKEEKEQHAVLVAGGFHSSGIEQLAAKNGMSFVEVTPHLTQIVDSKMYENVMMLGSASPAQSSYNRQPDIMNGWHTIGVKVGPGMERAYEQLALARSKDLTSRGAGSIRPDTLARHRSELRTRKVEAPLSAEIESLGKRMLLSYLIGGYRHNLYLPGTNSFIDDGIAGGESRIYKSESDRTTAQPVEPQTVAGLDAVVASQTSDEQPSPLYTQVDILAASVAAVRQDIDSFMNEIQSRNIDISREEIQALIPPVEGNVRSVAAKNFFLSVIGDRFAVAVSGDIVLDYNPPRGGSNLAFFTHFLISDEHGENLLRVHSLGGSLSDFGDQPSMGFTPDGLLAVGAVRLIDAEGNQVSLLGALNPVASGEIPVPPYASLAIEVTPESIDQVRNDIDSFMALLAEEGIPVSREAVEELAVPKGTITVPGTFPTVIVDTFRLSQDGSRFAISVGGRKEAENGFDIIPYANFLISDQNGVNLMTVKTLTPIYDRTNRIAMGFTEDGRLAYESKGLVRFIDSEGNRSSAFGFVTPAEEIPVIEEVVLLKTSVSVEFADLESLENYLTSQGIEVDRAGILELTANLPGREVENAYLVSISGNRAAITASGERSVTGEVNLRIFYGRTLLIAPSNPEGVIIVSGSDIVRTGFTKEQRLVIVPRNGSIRVFDDGGEAVAFPRNVVIGESLDAFNTSLESFFAYAVTSRSGVRTTAGDVDGLGRPEIIVAPGAGHAPTVKVYDTETGEFTQFDAYASNFKGGVYIASADVNGDGAADIITGAGESGGPHVRVFNGKNGALLYDFFAYDPAFTGGVRIAAGDVNGDGFADIVTAAGPAGGPHVKVFSGATGAEIFSFFAYDSRFSGGVYVAAADMNADGKAEIITGAGQNGGPHVRVFSGENGEELAGFFAYDRRFTGGVRVAAGDVNDDGQIDIITAAGIGGGPHVRAFNGITREEIFGFFAYDSGFTGGVYVAAADLNGDGASDIITGAGEGGGPHVRISFSESAEPEIPAYDRSLYGAPEAVYATPNGRYVNVDTDSSYIISIDLATGEVVNAFQGQPETLTSPSGIYTVKNEASTGRILVRRGSEPSVPYVFAIEKAPVIGLTVEDQGIRYISDAGEVPEEIFVSYEEIFLNQAAPENIPILEHVDLDDFFSNQEALGNILDAALRSELRRANGDISSEAIIETARESAAETVSEKYRANEALYLALIKAVVRSAREERPKWDEAVLEKLIRQKAAELAQMDAKRGIPPQEKGTVIVAPESIHPDVFLAALPILALLLNRDQSLIISDATSDLKGRIYTMSGLGPQLKARLGAMLEFHTPEELPNVVNRLNRGGTHGLAAQVPADYSSEYAAIVDDLLATMQMSLTEVETARNEEELAQLGEASAAVLTGLIRLAGALQGLRGLAPDELKKQYELLVQQHLGYLGVRQDEGGLLRLESLRSVAAQLAELKASLKIQISA